MQKHRMIYNNTIQEIAKALSSELRLKILEKLSGGRQLSITQLVELMEVAQPTVSINVQMLESAGLIKTLPGAGREKVVTRSYDTLIFNLPNDMANDRQSIEEITMPVGLYTDSKISGTCGIIRDTGVIGLVDNKNSFYLPERIHAGLIYFGDDGFVEYTFPIPERPVKEITQIMLSCEICSEAPGYQQYYPSDITLSINGSELATWTSPGDFGDRHGKLTPQWWSSGCTQYGDLIEWRVDTSGSYLNNYEAGTARLSDINLEHMNCLKVRIEVKPNAVNRRGLNLFGCSFGDYAQDLKMTYYYGNL